MLGRLRLCRLGLLRLLFLGRLVVADGTAGRGAQHGMMPRHMASHTAHGGPCHTTRVGREWGGQHCQNQ